MSCKIISIGELLWDLLPDRKILGGAPSNLAFRLNELGSEAYLVSRVGSDKFGQEAIEILESLGLSTNYIQIDSEYPTGTVEVTFDSYRNPDYVIIPDVAYDKIELTDELLNLARDSHCIAFGTLAQREEKTRGTIAGLINAASKAIKFLDINHRKRCYSRESVEISLQFADILKVNHHEAYELSSMLQLEEDKITGIAEKLSNHFHIQTILVTMEQCGAFLYDKKEGRQYVPGYNIDLEDPLGAGDAFSAAFLHAMFSGKTLFQACEEGNKFGAVVATKKGAIQRISMDELLAVTNNSDRVFDESLMEILKNSITN
jgi:fructokinase